MKVRFFPLLYKLNKKHRYLIWVENAGGEDMFYVDQKSCKIAIFSNLKSLRKYAKKRNMKIVKDSKPIMHDLDTVLKWVKHGTKKHTGYSEILSAWNFFIDMANTFELDNDELQAYRSKSPKAYKAYSKVFKGSNLPSITRDNPPYYPQLKKKELRLIRRVLNYGFEQFKNKRIKK